MFSKTLKGISNTLQNLRFVQSSVVEIVGGFVKNLLYGYHGNCMVTSCFSLIIVKTSMKNRYFSNPPRNHKLEAVKN